MQRAFFKASYTNRTKSSVILPNAKERNHAQKMKLFQFIKKVFGWIVLGLFILLISGGLLAFFKQDRIIEEIKKELNQSIESELGFHQANLRFFKTFPNFSIELTQFYILNQNDYLFENTDSFLEDSLLSAQSVFFELDLIQLFSGDMRIKSVKLDNGSIQLLENENEISNYSFLFESEDPGEESQTIRLESIQLNQIKLKYLSLSAETYLDGVLSSLKLKGKIDSLTTQFEAEGDIIIQQLKTDSTQYIQEFSGELQFSYSQDEDRFSINPFHFTSDGLDLIGKLDYRFEAEDLEVYLEAKENKISRLLSISPYAESYLPDSFVIDGLLNVKGSYSINYQTENFGKYMFETELLKGSLTFLSDSIELVQSEARSTLYNDSQDQLILNDLLFTTHFPLGGSAELKAKVILYDFLDLSGQLKLTLEPAQLASWSRVSSLKNWNGRLKGNFALRGIKLDLEQDNLLLLREMRPEGTLELSASRYEVPEYQLELTDIRMDISDENLRFSPFEILVNEQKLIFEKLELDRLFDLLNKQIIRINASVNSPSLDLLKLMPKAESNNQAGNETASDTYTIDGLVQFKAGEINYDRFKARQAGGTVQMINNQIVLKDVKMQTLNGNIALDAEINPVQNSRKRVELAAHLDEIDLHELLFSFRNFNQAYITHKELIGDLSGQIRLNAAIDSGLSLDYSTIKGRVNFTVKKGEITDLRSLRKLADFTHLEELQKIRFDAIEGTAELQEGLLKVYPSYIHSSVADINFYGEHSLGKQMDYRFEILLSPDFTGKKTEHLEAVNQEGRTKIYLKLIGSEEDYAVSYDMRALKDATKERMREEGSILKDAFQKEFGKKDSTIQGKEPKQGDQPVKKKTKVIWE